MPEHQQLDGLMEELNVNDTSSNLWMKTFENLVHDDEHHIDEEQNEAVARSRESIGEGESDD